ncbi:unnamed protein product [Rotaria socialis]|uniref:Uncharacterized protein n=1 Tax=Rotaria socialis TaxID=392032 RepID=A0A817P921_9BILA|nr:unnamed protein product [Rotaria socialis]CAF4274002.1 unnamed protein product [Rotaria socialis]
MTDRLKFDLVSDRASASSSKSRRSYSQRNVSSLQQELTKNRKMINVKTSTTTTFSRTMSFKPLPVTSPSLANVENTPVKIIPIKKLSFDIDASNTALSSQTIKEENEFVEETPVKEEDETSDMLPADIMAREIQRLSLRLRSTTPLYNVPVLDNQSNKPTTLHLSQVVNRVSRCNYVLRRFVREAQKYSPKSNEILSSSQPILSKPFSSSQSHEKGRRRLFIDSPKQKTSNTIFEDEQQPPITPRKASGVIKQLFSSPSSSLKRTLPSPNHSSTSTDKRPRLF